MDYGRFVELRTPVWDRFEAGLARLETRPREVGHQELEDLALRYRQVLHDHALAAARFPGTGATRRLARLGLRGTNRLIRRETGGAPEPVALRDRHLPRRLPAPPPRPRRGHGAVRRQRASRPVPGRRAPGARDRLPRARAGRWSSSRGTCGPRR